MKRTKYLFAYLNLYKSFFFFVSIASFVNNVNFMDRWVDGWMDGWIVEIIIS